MSDDKGNEIHPAVWVIIVLVVLFGLSRCSTNTAGDGPACYNVKGEEFCDW